MGRIGVLLRMVVVSVGGLLVCASAAAAGTPFRSPCPDSNFECTRVTVPVDRSGGVEGTIRLYVERHRGKGRGAVFAFAGGPGQGATSLTENFARDLFPVQGDRDLIVFDQRGTGKSGALNCPELEVTRRGAAPLPERAAACADELGPRRAFYTTRDSVEDIEAVRRRVGEEKITLYGVSYGTKVAVAYALSYPDRVERLVLDSVVEPEGQNVFDLDTWAAMPRVFREICRRECKGVTPDLGADVATLVDRMRAEPLRGPFVGREGRVRTVGITRRQLYDQIRSGDLLEELRAEYPGAIQSALDGDPAPLLRIEHRYDGLGQDQPEPEPQPELLSFSLFTATLCEEAPLPWERTAPFEDRRRRAEERAAAIPDSAFEPFDRETTLASDTDVISQCLRWPAAPNPPALGPGPLPDVPVLLLEGAEDLRTPVEVASRLAGRFPQAQLAVVPKTGHSVLGRGRKCADTILRRFFAGRAVGTPCAGVRRAARVEPVIPARLSDVRPARGVAGVRGRTLAAVGLTVRDLYSEYDDAALLLAKPRGGGLRAGRFFKRGREVRFSRFSLVPGVLVSGRLTASGKRSGRLKVSGSAAVRGSLVLRGDDVLRGRLGGRAVKLRLAAMRR